MTEFLSRGLLSNFSFSLAVRSATRWRIHIAKSFALEIRNPKCLLAGLTGCAIFSLGRKYKRVAVGIL
jgi:hypothetical protein